MSNRPEAQSDTLAIAGVVLAAGQSRRMGRPKLTLPWGDTTIIGKVVATLAHSGLSEIHLVTGGDRAEVEEAVRKLELDIPVGFVFNPDYQEDEMIVSIQAGLAALSDHLEAAVIALGDQPQIELGTVQALLEAYRCHSAGLIVPSYRMRRGHPWLVRRALWADVQALQAPQNLRDFLNANAEGIHYVSVDTESVLQDIDTPGDYQRFAGSS